MSAEFSLNEMGLALATLQFCKTNASQVSLNNPDFMKIIGSIEYISNFYDAFVLKVGEKHVPLHVKLEHDRLRLYRDVMVTFADSLSGNRISETFLEGFEEFKLVAARPPIPNREYIEYLRSVGICEDWLANTDETFPSSFELCSYNDFSKPMKSPCVFSLILDPLLEPIDDPFLENSVTRHLSLVGGTKETIVQSWLEMRQKNLSMYISPNLVSFIRNINVTSDYVLVRLFALSCKSQLDEFSYVVPVTLGSPKILTGLQWISALAILCLKSSNSNLLDTHMQPDNPIYAMIGISEDDIKKVRQLFVLLISKFEKNRVAECIQYLSESEFAKTVFENLFPDPMADLDNAIRVAACIPSGELFTELNIAWLQASLPSEAISALPKDDLVEWMADIAVASKQGSILTAVAANRMGLKQSMDVLITQKLLTLCFDADIEEYLSEISESDFLSEILKTAKLRIGFVANRLSEDTGLLHGMFSGTKFSDEPNCVLSEWILESPKGPLEIVQSASRLLHHPRIVANSEEVKDIKKFSEKLISVLENLG